MEEWADGWVEGKTKGFIKTMTKRTHTHCSTIPHETLPQIIAIMLHEMLPLVNATTNATMITDEHHDYPRDMPMLHESRPQMLQAEDERLATQCSTSASTHALS